MTDKNKNEQPQTPSKPKGAVVTRVVEINQDITKRRQELAKEGKKITVKKARRKKEKEEQQRKKQNQQQLRYAREYIAKHNRPPLSTPLMSAEAFQRLQEEQAKKEDS